jgi:flagellar hook-associated protein 3 FlgL
VTRITEGMLSRQLLSDLHASKSLSAKSQRELSSGVRIHNPSDDPLATQTILRLKGELEGIEQDQRSVSDARGWLDTTESALAQLTEVAQRARELTVQAANGSASPLDRAAIGKEIEQLIGMAKSAANATYAGRHVLSGSATDTAPYTAGAVDTYNGDTGAIARSLGPGVAIQVNITGQSVLGEGDYTDPADTGLLTTLRKLAFDLSPAGNQADIGTDDLNRIDADINTITSARGAIGALSNRVDSANARLMQAEESTTSLLSENEDSDIGKALIDLTTQQSVYEAALRSGSALIQPSLLDFLR